MTKERILYRQIDEILWKNWDPIGINDCLDARDEYYDYLPHVWRLKLQNADVETITMYLFRIEVDNMGLFGNIESCRRVAAKIHNLQM